MTMPSVRERESWIRQEAARLGIDPEVAVRVARSEGLKEGTWQSDVMKNGVREPSYGDFQLYTGGGLGNRFEDTTGLQAEDPSNWRAMNTYALEQAKTGGWSPWYGAKNVGITGMEGIGGMPASSVDAPQPPSNPLGIVGNMLQGKPPPQAPVDQKKGIGGIIENFMSNMGQQQAPAPAPAPMIQAGRYEGGSTEQNPYGLPSEDDETMEELIRRITGR